MDAIDWTYLVLATQFIAIFLLGGEVAGLKFELKMARRMNAALRKNITDLELIIREGIALMRAQAARRREQDVGG